MANGLSKEAIVFLVVAVLAVGYVMYDSNGLSSNIVTGQAYKIPGSDFSKPLPTKYGSYATPLSKQQTQDNVIYCTQPYSSFKSGSCFNVYDIYSGLEESDYNDKYHGGKKLTKSYSCVYSPIPESLKLTLCPKGMTLVEAKSSMNTYYCSSSSAFNNIKCAAGYEFNVYSIPKNGELFTIRCKKISTASQKLLPCGNSGAEMVSTPSWTNYCCGYFE